MNKYTKLENCANNAAVTCSDVTASNSRVAGIVSAMGGHTYLTSCVNNGTVAFAVAGDTTHGYAAGIAGQTNDNNTAIDGCENYGAVLSDIINAAANKYIGIVCANTNKKTIAIRNCKVGGRIGPFSDGQQGATEITEQNFEQYIYFTLTGGGVPTLENNSFFGRTRQAGHCDGRGPDGFPRRGQCGRKYGAVGGCRRRGVAARRYRHEGRRRLDADRQRLL